MTFYNKFKLVWKLLSIVESDESWGLWSTPDRPTEKVEQYFKIIIKKYEWELRAGRNISGILDALNQEKRNLEEMHSRMWKEVRQTHKQIDSMTKDIQRYEGEVVVLKDIIQEKNMVIDKLKEKP